MMRKGWLTLVLALLVGACGAGTAGAVVVRTPPGRFLSLAPHRGVKLRPAAPAARGPRAAGTADNGTLYYQGGIVLHSSTPYLIFWDPPGATQISATSKSLLERYFTDVAHDSGSAASVYGVNRQFYDDSGFADYKQTFDAATQAINDTHAFPAIDSTNCPDTGSGYPNCVTDAQLQAELTRLNLPGGVGANAPIYFIVTPPDTNVCAAGLTGPECADNAFCAYHSSYGNVLYAAIPMFIGGDPKSCQFDNIPAVQEPNGDFADVVLKYLSHEDNETITDPTGYGWWDSGPPGADPRLYSGNENGDNCNFYGPTDPPGGYSPTAFAPTLGGDQGTPPTPGTLYDQLINANKYYIQSEWSNGGLNCDLHPAAGTISPSISAPGSAAPGSAVTLDPSPSRTTAGAGFSSETWDFGDGSASAFNGGGLTPVTHTYSTGGIYTVTLTLVDWYGNVAIDHYTIKVGPLPTAVFSASPTAPKVGDSITFNGGKSSDPRSGVTLSYLWNFGDGTTSTTGPNTTHAYAQPGTYTATLTVTDSQGYANSTSQQVFVAALGAPTARIILPGGKVRSGLATNLDGSGSVDPNARLQGYSWSFGDGSPDASGTTVHHTFTRTGFFQLKLTVTDSDGKTSTATTPVRVWPALVQTAFKHRVLRVTVDQGGAVRVGSRVKRLGQAGSTKFKVLLRPAQQRTLASRHIVRVKLKLVFTPQVGPAVTKQVTVTLRA